MPDYSKSVIYTIRSKDNIYVGSTVNFRSRKKQHKNCITKLLTADLNSQSCGTGLDRPDYKKQHNKQYYETHYEKYRDEFNKKRRQKFTCECGGVTTKGGLSIHRKSKKHILGMEKLNQ